MSGRLLRALRTLVLTAVLALGGTAAQATDVDLSAIHSIGVIPAIGQGVALKNVGFMAFSNSLDVIDASGWGIDDQVYSQIAAALAGRYTVRRIAADATAFSTPETGWFATSEVPVEDLVSRLTDRDGIDAYLVCYPFAIEDRINPTNQYLRGLGVYRHSGLVEHVAFYAFYRCALIDAKTNKWIVGGAGLFGEQSLFDSPWAIVTADPSVWAAKASDLTDLHRETIRKNMLDIVGKSLPWALSEMGLAPKPPNGD